MASKAASSPPAKTTSAPAPKKVAESAPKKVAESVPKKEEKKPTTTTTTTTSTTTPVPETILKKRRTAEETKALREKAKVEKTKKLRLKRKTIFKRAEQYVKEYRAQERSLIRFRRQAKSVGNYYVEPDQKLAVVIRIRGINGLHPKPKKKSCNC